MPVETSRKTQQERKSQSQKKLFDALITLINRDGIKAATCERIGKEAGLSRGMANQRLGKRKQMFENLVARLGADQLETMAHMNIHAGSGYQALLDYIDVHFDAVINNPGYQAYFVLVAGSVADTPLLKDCVQQAHQFVHQLLTEFILKGQQDKSLNHGEDAEQNAAILGSYLLGVAIQAKFTDAESVEKLKAGAVALISRMKSR
ncbi:MAG: TetR/AcrR family transcriptional regulator [Cellvibrionaceae bacterium]